MVSRFREGENWSCASHISQKEVQFQATVSREAQTSALSAFAAAVVGSSCLPKRPQPNETQLHQQAAGALPPAAAFGAFLATNCRTVPHKQRPLSTLHPQPCQPPAGKA